MRRSFDMTASNTTTDHNEIRKWVESRKGRPAKVRNSGGEGGVLRIDFGKPEENLEAIEWEEFFEILDDRKLAFLYQDRTADGETSRFSKFVSRD
jgi:hypothetical protein